MELKGMVKEVSDKDFEKEVLKSEKPTIVDFWAPWCGPCRLMGPVVEELAKNMPDLKFVKINVDENQITAAKYEIYSIPTLVVFSKGKEHDRIIGFLPKEDLKKEISNIKV